MPEGTYFFGQTAAKMLLDRLISSPGVLTPGLAEIHFFDTTNYISDHSQNDLVLPILVEVNVSKGNPVEGLLMQMNVHTSSNILLRCIDPKCGI